jgi:hypothetical protein
MGGQRSKEHVFSLFQRRSREGFFDVGNSNLRSKHPATPLVDWEPMEIEFAGITLF